MRASRRNITLVASVAALALTAFAVLALWSDSRMTGDAGVVASFNGLSAIGNRFVSSSEGPRSFEELFAGLTPKAEHWWLCAPNPFPDLLPEDRRYGRTLWLLIDGAKPAEVPLMWDEEPDSRGETAVLYYDGRCERIDMSDLETAIQRTSWLPAGPNGRAPEKALVKVEERPQEVVDKEVEAKRWAYAGSKQYTSPPNVYRPTGRPPDWVQVRQDRVAGHPEALFAVIGMTREEVRGCLGPTPYPTDDEPMVYPYGVHPPEYDGLTWSLILEFDNGRCVTWSLDD